MNNKLKLVVGIDEAGRGPLAGPVSVGVVVVSHDFDWDLLPGVTDSKKLSEKKRGVIFAEAKRLKAEKKLDFNVAMVSAKQIDEIGISAAIKLAISQAIASLELDPKICFIKLDGSLHAPEEFSQETIIKGDAKEKVIGLASICAKETRDEYMVQKSAEPIFAPYDFATHKGYGTKAHRALITKLGTTIEHRETYCRGCK